ncbi:MAG TPA: hypothetical protein VKA69_02225, partial [Desulfobacteria bacterium]|nr:hypothetical protein [Desulfobacteria bacterium]
MKSKLPDLPKPPATVPDLQTDHHGDSALITAIVGGGNACYEILKQYREGQLDQMNLKIMGV